jgi:hypothetical protein
MNKKPQKRRRTWHWRKRYFEVGEHVKLHALFRKLPPRGVVAAWKRNKWGRVSYVISGSDGHSYKVLLEDIVPSTDKVVR